MKRKQPKHVPPTLPKSRTGITGLDEITGGGLPSGRPTLVCGSAGCGKTMLAMEFLVRGAVQFGEPGVLMFEENARDLTDNVRSLGFDLDQLVAKKKILLDHVQELVSTGARRSARARSASRACSRQRTPPLLRAPSSLPIFNPPPAP